MEVKPIPNTDKLFTFNLNIINPTTILSKTEKAVLEEGLCKAWQPHS